MNIKKFILFYFSITNTSYANNYQTAVENFNKQLYESCINNLVNEQSINANILKAISYYKIKKYQDAIDILLIVKDMCEKENNENLSEVKYWLSISYFEQNDFINGLKYIDNDFLNVKYKFINEYTDFNILNQCINEFKNDDFIIKTWLYKESLLEYKIQNPYLINRYIKNDEYKKYKYWFKKKYRTIKQNKYNIGVFLPFYDYYTKTKGNTSRFNNPQHLAIKIYRGFFLAAKDIDNINIYYYDYTDPKQMLDILLNTNEIKSLDCIIGYNDIRLQDYALENNISYHGLADYSDQFNINFFDILSTDMSFIKKYQRSYLVKSSIISQTYYVSNYIKKEYEKLGDEMHIAVVYENDNEHVIYQLKSLINNIHIEKEININEKKLVEILFNIRKSLRNKDNEEITQQYKEDINLVNLDNITHIYIASSNVLLVSNIISIVKIFNSKAIIICDNDFIYTNMIDTIEDFIDNQQVVLIGDGIIDYKNPKLIDFINKFKEEFKSYPTYMSVYSYEFMRYLAKQFNTYGVYPKWDRMDGEILSGFDYKVTHDNNYVCESKIFDECKNKIIIN